MDDGRFEDFLRRHRGKIELAVSAAQLLALVLIEVMRKVGRR